MLGGAGAVVVAVVILLVVVLNSGPDLSTPEGAAEAVVSALNSIPNEELFTGAYQSDELFPLLCAEKQGEARQAREQADTGRAPTESEAAALRQIQVTFSLVSGSVALQGPSRASAEIEMTVADVPAEFEGRFKESGDADTYRFELENGEWRMCEN